MEESERQARKSMIPNTTQRYNGMPQDQHYFLPLAWTLAVIT
jgi:hypothetical protein